MAKENNNYVIYSSRDEYAYEDFCREMLDRDMFTEDDMPDECSDEFYEWQDEMREMEWDDFCENLKYSECDNEHVLVTGDLGLWNGRHPIEPEPFASLHEAIERCIGECDDWKVEMIDHVVWVSAYHHDGVNSFAILPLTKLGCEKIYDDEEDPCDYRETWVGLWPDYLY